MTRVASDHATVCAHPGRFTARVTGYRVEHDHARWRGPAEGASPAIGEQCTSNRRAVCAHADDIGDGRRAESAQLDHARRARPTESNPGTASTRGHADEH